MSKRFRQGDLNQPYLLPPTLQDWLPADHLARFIGEVCDQLDLSAVYAGYDARGRAGLCSVESETPILVWASITRKCPFVLRTGCFRSLSPWQARTLPASCDLSTPSTASGWLAIMLARAPSRARLVQDSQENAPARAWTTASGAH